MPRATALELKSFKRRRLVQALITLALPLWLGVLLYVDWATDFLPQEQPERGRAILIAFFAAVFVALVVQLSVWRCPSCKRLLNRLAFFTKRCGACDAEFR